MKAKKIITNIILFVICISLGLASGYLIGKYILFPNKNKSEPEPQTKKVSDNDYLYPVMQITPSPVPTIISTYYILKNENEVLKLYEVKGDMHELIKSIDFNSDMLPAEDREKLKKGIRIASKEDGFTLIEDFSS